jgi:hypothetical protein
MASNVDLPAPLGPMRPVRVPRRTSMVTPGDGVYATEIAGHVPHEAPRPHPMQQKKVPNG